MAMQAIDPPYVSDIDPFSHEAIHHDSLLREVGPVVYLPQYDIWVVARHAEVQEVLRDWETYSPDVDPARGAADERPARPHAGAGVDTARPVRPGDGQDGFLMEFGDGGVPRPVGPAARGSVARPRGVGGE